MEKQDSGYTEEAVRLNKFLALAGVGSRRKNDDLIRSGLVSINGEVVREMGIRVNPATDRVEVEGERVNITAKPVYILLNKPKDCITTMHDERGRKTVRDLVKTRDRVVPVGRLDRNTKGVLFLTNDGTLAHLLTHPKSEIERVYRVRVEESIPPESLRKIRRGVRLEDGMARVREAKVIPGTKHRELILVIAEGRNREVRRIMEVLGHTVKDLERVSFAGLTAEGLGRGKWRYLGREEIRYLKKLVGLKKATDQR